MKGRDTWYIQVLPTSCCLASLKHNLKDASHHFKIWYWKTASCNSSRYCWRHFQYPNISVLIKAMCKTCWTNNSLLHELPCLFGSGTRHSALESSFSSIAIEFNFNVHRRMFLSCLFTSVALSGICVLFPLSLITAFIFWKKWETEIQHWNH